MIASDALIEKCLDGPYRIVDVLPERVPADAQGQYPAVERYFLQTERLAALRRRQAELILRLNAYYDMRVSYDYGDSWEDNPEPLRFVEAMTALSNGRTARVLFPEPELMIDLDGCDTYMTVYKPSDGMRGMLEKLAQAEGLFLWE